VAGLIGFFARRWRGQVPLPRLFWLDMIGVATAVNLLASLAALILLAQKVDPRLAVALHFAPLPYNLFLFMAVWRSPQRSAWTSAMAIAWFALMMVL
jgi:hypothetical protein